MQKVERPNVTSGPTIKKITGCGNLYVRVMGDNNGHNPIEVFANLGKSGGCTQCQLEALTRSVSLGLKYGIPAQEYIDELLGIACPGRNMWPEEERTLSCADAIARALQEYFLENSKV